jgi:hypothetical protein
MEEIKVSIKNSASTNKNAGKTHRNKRPDKPDYKSHPSKLHSKKPFLQKPRFQRYLKFLIPILILAGIGTYAVLNFTDIFRDKSSQETPDSSEQTKVTTFHIQKDVPENFAKALEEELTALSENNFNLKKSNNSSQADIKVTVSTSSEVQINSIEFYRVFALTKSWTNLGYEPQKKITSHSEYISAKTIELLQRDLLQGYELTKSPQDNTTENSQQEDLKLELLQELDSTRIIIPVQNLNPLEKSSWEDVKYPLVISFAISAEDEDLIKEIRDAVKDSGSKFQKFIAENYYFNTLPKPRDFTSIAKTGTSVAGGPGWYLCERTKGLSHATESVEDFLASADLTIVSNESPFVEGCIQDSGTMAFCGKPNYIENLIRSGVDIISLTGNHMADYGRGAFINTMKIYEQNEMEFFGAGENLTQAWNPLRVELDNTRNDSIYMLGYNKMGPSGVLATDNLAGTSYYDKDRLENAIQSVENENQSNDNETNNGSSNSVWVDTHLWPEYGTTPTTEQQRLSQEAVDFGADIVIGVSSHEIQPMTFYNDKPIFYGLGNFWFDQLLSEKSRQGVALKIQMYNNQIANIEIHPTYMQDYCSVILLAGDEKTQMLRYLNDISKF